MNHCTQCRDSRTIRHPLIYIIVIMLIVGCSSGTTQPQQLPTLVEFPTATASPLPSLTPQATITPSVTLTLTPSPTLLATSTASATATLFDTATPTYTITPTLIPSQTPIPTPLPETFIFGQSVEGRDLVGYRYGRGRFVIMLIGGIHAGFEANTIDLVSELRAHFRRNSTAIDPAVTLIFIPSLNPDGAARGRILEGRFNANDVDLNRNWACGWSPDAVFGQGVVDPGNNAFSEPETTALGSLIQRVQPAAVLFYHAAANGVFAGNCGDGAGSDDLAAIYGQASGYPFGSDFDAYAVTGTAPAWVDSIGIPALDVELASADATEFNRNLRAIIALQMWVQR